MNYMKGLVNENDRDILYRGWDCVVVSFHKHIFFAAVFASSVGKDILRKVKFHG